MSLGKKNLLSALSIAALLACGDGLMVTKGEYTSGEEKDPGPTATEQVETKKEEFFNPSSTSDQTREGCFGNQSPARIAFVVDNSGSNNSTPGELQTPGPGELYTGTDAIRNTPTAERDTGSGYTNRQLALFTLINEMTSQNQSAKSKHADWPGIDVGIASFPLSEADLINTKHISGDSLSLPEKMTNLNTLITNESTLSDLWELLKFTHFPEGMTPYHTALRNGKELLESGNSENDGRKRVIVLITDGLPTDQNPQSIIDLRKSMGDTEVHLVSVYKTLTPEEENASEAKSTLQDLYNNPSFNWGKEHFDDFEAYWSALREVPAKIATRSYSIASSTELYGVLSQIASEILSCSNEE